MAQSMRRVSRGGVSSASKEQYVPLHIINLPDLWTTVSLPEPRGFIDNSSNMNCMYRLASILTTSALDIRFYIDTIHMNNY
jgi:hypothetical protein